MASWGFFIHSEFRGYTIKFNEAFCEALFYLRSLLFSLVLMRRGGKEKIGCDIDAMLRHLG